MNKHLTIDTDVLYDANIFTLDLERSVPSMGAPEFSEKPSRPSKSLVDAELYKKLTNLKDKITLCQKWEKWAKLINPYKNLYKDYYKFYEIIKYYDIDKKKSALYIFDDHGAMEAVKKLNKDIECSHTPNDKKFDIIIGNGNMDVKHDPNNQEQLNLYNIFTQTVVALNHQSENGTFIFRIFDTLTRPTCQIIYYLTKFYDVSIIKPRTTRLTNSEKFVVAQNFKRSEEHLNNIKWNPDDYCRTFNIDMPESVEKSFYDFNMLLVNIQFSYIEKTMYYSYKDDTDIENQFDAFQNKKVSDLYNTLDISPSNICKHLKKSKVKYRNLDLSMCDKCFCLLIGF